MHQSINFFFCQSFHAEGTGSTSWQWGTADGSSCATASVLRVRGLHMFGLRLAMDLRCHPVIDHNAPTCYLQSLLAKSFQEPTSPSTPMLKGFLQRKLAQHVRLRLRRRRRPSQRLRSVEGMRTEPMQHRAPSTRSRRSPSCRGFLLARPLLGFLSLSICLSSL